MRHEYEIETETDDLDDVCIFCRLHENVDAIDEAIRDGNARTARILLLRIDEYMECLTKLVKKM